MINKSLSYIGIFLLNALSVLPLFLLYKIADVFYLLIFYVFKYRRKVVKENLYHSFPDKSADELNAIEKEYYKFLSSLFVEVIKMKSISKKELNKRVKFKNTDLVEAYLQNNESVIFCSSHYGNYEWVCMAIGLNFSGEHFPIYKPLSSEVFDQWFFNMRSKYGNQMVAMRQTLRAIQGSKDKATMFTFGCDQAPSRGESIYWTDFLNQKASVQLGVEKIAKKTNRPVFYLKINCIKRGYYEVDCVPICLDPKQAAAYEITELHTRFLEEMIAEKPDYWLWSHRRWKYKPDENLIKLSASSQFQEA